MDYEVRKPTKKECSDIANALLANDEERQILQNLFKQLSTQRVNEHIKEYCIIVVDDYVSDAQGYIGKIIIIIWGTPEFITRLIEDEETRKLTVLRERRVQ